MTPKQLEKIEQFVDFVRNAPVYSGICCCGDSMEGHTEGMQCGHSATDQWDWSLHLWLETLDPLIAAAKVSP